jgi:hypothetical protein
MLDLDKPIDLPIVVDSTTMGDFHDCGQKFVWGRLHGLQATAVSIDLHAGGCFASAIETLYTSAYKEEVSLDIALARALYVFEKQWGDFIIPEGKKTTKTKDRVWAAVESYLDTYHPPTDWVEPWPDVENPFEYSFAVPLTRQTTGLDMPMHPSGDPFLYCGRFDMIGKHSGIPVIRDEKTTTSIAYNWSDQFGLRSQFIGYCWAMQTLGFNINTVVIRGVGILKTEIQHKELIKQYPRFLTERWLVHLQRDLERMVDSWETRVWDYSLGNACTNYGGCQYRALCESPTPEQWANNYVVRHWNPLIKATD